jgi:hypothetical protein
MMSDTFADDAAAAASLPDCTGGGWIFYWELAAVPSPPLELR